MESISEINLPNQILSLAVAGGLVAFAFLILRLLNNGIKQIISKLNANKLNQGEREKK
tara:strand:+ start:226 stop:399 length:174 start_codon:yes stop_codon:yes gene_type:complete